MSAGPTTTPTSDAPPETPSPSALRRVSLALADIKLAHSVFALPFAILAAFLVAPITPPDTLGELVKQFSTLVVYERDGWSFRLYELALWYGAADIDWVHFAELLLLVVVCMVLARTWAMLVNRMADRRLDAANPRTTERVFARGALAARDGYALLALTALGFLISCYGFVVVGGWLRQPNWWPLVLSVPVLGFIALYSYTKRFTWLCHVFLGAALAISPLAAVLAVSGSFWALNPIPDVTVNVAEDGRMAIASGLRVGGSVPWLALMVLFWVAGFDVIYALQDLDFDRETGLKSVPARFGWRGAAWIARGVHALALAALGVAWAVEPRFGWVFGVGVGVVAAALALEHAVLARRGREGIPMAFFTLNGVVSLVLGSAGVADALL